MGKIMARNEQEHQRLTKEIEGITNTRTAHLTDVEKRLERAKADYEQQLKDREDKHLNEKAADHDTHEALERENKHLKSFIGEHRAVAAGIPALHSRLEGQIQQLQTHTGAIRNDL